MKTQNSEGKAVKIESLVKAMLLAIQRAEFTYDLGERLELRVKELRTKDVMTKKQEEEILKAAALKKRQIYKKRRLEFTDAINWFDSPEEIKDFFRKVSGKDVEDRILLQPENNILKNIMPEILDKENIDLFRTKVNFRLKELNSSEIS
ncbi:MAG: hypothetical protein COZ34_05115 [Candidatus Pacebacteria bacterium CG_4_10_14_3_um_filter_34_15]|nr:hypothetical protein [Candidatus Pacearchaeota archaeon]NCQ65437.1 hypothetical protein [Candidatus Paceibacterota bacterium]OIO44184.1 MAG: hypothetical protein AUJ41_03295 [Candidatus Pacebacteria bacterium CG1_02_43_31]PIQ80875.1 MAG: hypothetical protein COV78_03270 [Candidatus Pacebacteria bacterium CG11_big_fil_rev_8_21_14_0_20_34_55]PIX81067.1 MAG: hypothetical protein COZ34_05115 [Candidatus Pacebacteria bacterium CG_4_10_14_3_um_filter_34_15]PJC43336.1 MAG: hypothetical protein CO0